MLIEKGATSWLTWQRHDSGHHFYGRLELTSDRTVHFAPQYIDGLICYSCHQKVLVTPHGWECEGGEIQVGKLIANRTITTDEARQLFLYGSTDTLAGFVSKETGKRYSAKLIVEQDKKINFRFM